MGAAVLAGRRVLTPHGLVGPARVVVERDRIVAIEPAGAAVPDVTLAPGFVDLQVNGIDDVDCNGPGTDWERLDELLLAQGTTTWCPTLVTAPLEQYRDKLAEIDEAAARAGARPTIVGVHLEGPFLGTRPGAHRAELIVPVDLDWLRRLPPVVVLVTLAPEQPDAEAAIRLLRDRGVVVALGHTGADTDQVCAAVDAGAGLVTHLFNAMAPLDHREPGPVGVALADDRLTVSLIADTHHVHPDVLRLTARAKGRGHFVLVTDSVAWRTERLAGRGIGRDGADGPPRLADGTLAGSALTMDRAVATMVHRAGIALDDALEAASTTPARVLRLLDRGRLAPGFRADVVALDGALRPVATWVGGRVAWTS
jgi:N-acetylglucosamine-6-phosphate deacetylase